MTIMSKTASVSDRRHSTKESALSSDGGRALANATETWLNAAAECQREMMSFMSMRLEKDGATTREMMACRNLADVAAIQSQWIEETLRDYNSEMTKLMAICSKSVDGGGQFGR